MGYGLPVIATTAGAASEIISPGENGQLLTPGDATMLAKHVGAWHKNRETLAQSGRAAHRQYCEHPDWQTTCNLITAFLKGTLAAKR